MLRPPKVIHPKTKNLVIFFILTAAMLLAFQNCSSAFFMLSSLRPAKAKTNFEDLLKESEKEIDETKEKIKMAELDLSSADYQERQTASAVETQKKLSSFANSTNSVTTYREVKDMKIKLIQKRNKNKN